MYIAISVIWGGSVPVWTLWSEWPFKIYKKKTEWTYYMSNIISR